MRFSGFGLSFFVLCMVTAIALPVQSAAQTPSSSHQNSKKSAAADNDQIEAGAVVNGLYRNKTLGLSCKVPDGWVLRTEEMNKGDDAAQKVESAEKSPPPGTQRTTEEKAEVLLAAFSRPPEAKGEDVNSSIVIAAESVAAYPGLKDAVQYMAGPISDAAKAQGFEMDEEPYGIAIGTTTVVRGDFHKDVGTRVMRQSTLALLSHGNAVSITVISGTEDEVEELIDGLEFQGAPRSKRAPN